MKVRMGDFVDVGLPSTVHPEDEYREELTGFRWLYVRDKESLPVLDEFLRELLGLGGEEDGDG